MKGEPKAEPKQKETLASLVTLLGWITASWIADLGVFLARGYSVTDELAQTAFLQVLVVTGTLIAVGYLRKAAKSREE